MYNRRRAVAYAHRWAFERNPAWGVFDEMGGDCANFVSQCLFAGSGVMDETPGIGWYYVSLNHRAPAWSGVEELRRYLTRKDRRPGPYGIEAPMAAAQPGDVDEALSEWNELHNVPEELLELLRAELQ